jgi:hypothetical protein
MMFRSDRAPLPSVAPCRRRGRRAIGSDMIGAIHPLDLQQPTWNFVTMMKRDWVLLPEVGLSGVGQSGSHCQPTFPAEVPNADIPRSNLLAHIGPLS